MFNILVKQYLNATSLVGYIHNLANVYQDIFLAQASDHPNPEQGQRTLGQQTTFDFLG